MAMAFGDGLVCVDDFKFRAFGFLPLAKANSKWLIANGPPTTIVQVSKWPSLFPTPPKAGDTRKALPICHIENFWMWIFAYPILILHGFNRFNILPR